MPQKPWSLPKAEDHQDHIDGEAEAQGVSGPWRAWARATRCTGNLGAGPLCLGRPLSAAAQPLPPGCGGAPGTPGARCGSGRGPPGAAMQPSPKLRAAPLTAPGGPAPEPSPSFRPQTSGSRTQWRAAPGTHGHKPLARGGHSQLGSQQRLQGKALTGDILPPGTVGGTWGRPLRHDWRALGTKWVGPGKLFSPHSTQEAPQGTRQPRCQGAGTEHVLSRFPTGPSVQPKQKEGSPQAGARSELPPASPRVSKQRGRREGTAGARRCTQGPRAHCPGRSALLAPRSHAELLGGDGGLGMIRGTHSLLHGTVKVL